MSNPRKPTIDERIQALTQSLELLVSLHRDMEKRQEEREKRQEALEKRQEQDAAAIHQLALIAREALTSIQSLERIATAHQQRLDDHGQRIQRLEDQ